MTALETWMPLGLVLLVGCDEPAGRDDPDEVPTCATGGDCGPACAFPEAEHPSYTTPELTVALCGNTYDATNIETACGSDWHVCRRSEWGELYPEGVYPEGDESTFGADQTVRCQGGVWEASRPTGDATWADSVCYDQNPGNAPYNPYNNGKYLFDDDGTTLLEGDGGVGNWDSDFAATTDTDGFAVYCCRVTR